MKLQEVRAILGKADVEIDSQDLDGAAAFILKFINELVADSIYFLTVPELQGTTQEIAMEKCRHAANILQGPCITEDTALCFEALNGLPGPYIKHFLKGLGLEGVL